MTNSQSSDLERLRSERTEQQQAAMKVRVGGIVLAKLGAVGPADECKVEAIAVVATGREKTEADLTSVRLYCRVLLRPSGRKLVDGGDMSQGPWEPGETRTVLLPGYVVESVVSDQPLPYQGRYPNQVAFLSDGWAVRFRGCVEAARWNGKGAAEAHLELLEKGQRLPQPEIR